MRSCTPAFIVMASVYDEDDAELFFLQYSAICMYLEPAKATRQYMRLIFAHRCEHGDFYHLVNELEFADGEDFMRYARFTHTLLQEVLKLVSPHAEHNPTHRIPIGPKERPIMTIRFTIKIGHFSLFIHYNLLCHIRIWRSDAFPSSALSTSLGSIFSFHKKHITY